LHTNVRCQNQKKRLQPGVVCGAMRAQGPPEDVPRPDRAEVLTKQHSRHNRRDRKGRRSPFLCDSLAVRTAIFALFSRWTAAGSIRAFLLVRHKPPSSVRLEPFCFGHTSVTMSKSTPTIVARIWLWLSRNSLVPSGWLGDFLDPEVFWVDLRPQVREGSLIQPPLEPPRFYAINELIAVIRRAPAEPGLRIQRLECSQHGSAWLVRRVGR
jgi:hypothetical protein